MQQKVLPVFTHIPKTAGSALNRILTEQYFLKPGLSFAGGGPPFFDRFISLSEKDKRNLKVVKEHFHFGVHRHCSFPVRYFTMLRQPEKRTISHYNKVHRLGKHDPRYKKEKPTTHSLIEFLEKGIVNEMDNGMVRYLCGVEGIPYGGVNEQHLQLAIDNLKHYYLVGLTERFAESVLLFAKDLGWSTPYFVEGNVSPVRAGDVVIDAQTQTLLTYYNRYDEILYSAGIQMFNKQLELAGPGFADKVADFLVRNEKRRMITILNIHLLSKFRYFNKHHLGNIRQLFYEYMKTL